MQDVTNTVTLLPLLTSNFVFISVSLNFELLMSFQNISTFLVFKGTLDKLRIITE
jgi:hypothetical protein